MSCNSTWTWLVSYYHFLLFSYNYLLAFFYICLQVSVSKARAVVVLAEDGNADQVTFIGSIIFSFSITYAGSERISTQRLYCAKVSRKNTVLWLAARYRRHDYGKLQGIKK
ncbi:hypothetical protein GW17_00033738 [Ensete ventricosum]|nr:hypothetical protein GW17_00033738 [Ensete ventricosum]